MKIYFVRHGQTKSNEKGTVTGQNDSPLTDLGIKQARDIFKKITEDYSEIYSADLVRCKQTAEIINKKFNLQIKVDSRLRERDFGLLAGKKFEEMDPDGILKKNDINQKYDYRPYGGESVEDVKKRVLAFIDDLKQKSFKGKILVITSGGIIRLLYFILKGEVHEIIQNSSIHEFEFID